MDLDAKLDMGRRFKFESFWPKVEGFVDTVKQAWHTVSSQRNPFIVLDSKLHATAKALQSWSDPWIGNIRLQLSITLEVIGRLDVAAESSGAWLEGSAASRGTEQFAMDVPICAAMAARGGLQGAKEAPSPPWLRRGYGAADLGSLNADAGR